MLTDNSLVLGKIDTEGLVISDVAFDPLDVWSEMAQHLVRFSGRSAELLPLKGADIRNVSFNDKPAQELSPNLGDGKGQAAA